VENDFVKDFVGDSHHMKDSDDGVGEGENPNYLAVDLFPEPHVETVRLNETEIGDAGEVIEILNLVDELAGKEGIVAAPVVGLVVR
jgi:hypothetical protein